MGEKRTMSKKDSPLNPLKKIYSNGKALSAKAIPFIITKGSVGGKVLARGNNAQIVDGQLIFPSNLTLKGYIGEKVTVILGWHDDEDYKFIVYEHER